MALSELLPVIAPLICAVGAVVLLLADLAIPKDRKETTAWLAAGVMALALIVLPTQWGKNTAAFGDMVASDGYALILDALLLVIGIVVVALSVRYNEARGIMRGEFYPLMLFALSGMLLMGHSTHLLMVFVAIELLSIPLYVLCGFARPRVDSEESALKYFLLGAFASGFLVYGMALVYGGTGTLSLITLSKQFAGKQIADQSLTLAGAALILVGLGFKVAAAPFHMWTPDVYEGAPMPVTAFMTAATKAAGFAALLRVFMFGLEPLMSVWQTPVAVMAALSMIVGNLVALSQTNLKRMLAYSSIAHAGYLLAGVASGGEMGAGAVVFYLATYALTTLAAFAVMTAVSSGAQEDSTLEAYAGLGRRKPLLAIVMAISMLSLLGIPPTAGFFGKYFLINAAVQQPNLYLAGVPWLALVIVITSVISAGYYLRVLTTLFMRESASDEPILSHRPRAAAGFVMAAGTLLAGLFSQPVIQMISDGIRSAVR